MVAAQGKLRGKVVDKENSRPLAGASIFLNNTSIGTTSNEAGLFELNIPAGKYDLVISSIGFETRNLVIESMDIPSFLEIKLTVKAPEMETVVITSYEKDGWEKYGQFFTDQFIGMCSEAGQCKILNKEVLRFRYDKKANTLFVSALQPLQIENRALGYTLIYDLVQFEYKYHARYLVFTGFPFFIKMEGSESQEKKWKNKREDVFEGSLLHFMRALFRNQLEKEGFIVRRLVKEVNEEFQRVNKVMVSGFAKDRLFMRYLPKDTAAYFEKVMEQPRIREHLGKEMIWGDSIAFMVDRQTVGFEFDHFLHIYYKNKKPQSAYFKLFPRAASQIVSELTITGPTHIELKSNGMYFNSTDLLILGYWAWSEKIAAMLPFDYQPPQRN